MIAAHGTQTALDVFPHGRHRLAQGSGYGSLETLVGRFELG